MPNGAVRPLMVFPLIASTLLLGDAEFLIRHNLEAGDSWMFVLYQERHTEMTVNGHQGITADGQLIDSKPTRAAVSGTVEVIESAKGTASAIRWTLDSARDTLTAMTEAFGKQEHVVDLGSPGQTVIIKQRNVEHNLVGQDAKALEETVRAYKDIVEAVELPGKPLAIGESWAASAERLSAWEPAIRLATLDYELQAVKEVSGLRLAVVAMKGSGVGDVQGQPNATARYNLVGRALLDVQSARVVSADFDLVVNASGRNSDNDIVEGVFKLTTKYRSKRMSPSEARARAERASVTNRTVPPQRNPKDADAATPRGDADGAALGASFEAFARKFLREYENEFKIRGEGHVGPFWTCDVKQTDSIVNPVVGVLEFKFYMTLHDRKDCVARFAPRNGRWVPVGGTEVWTDNRNNRAYHEMPLIGIEKVTAKVYE